MGDLREACFDYPSPWFFTRGFSFSCFIGESSMTIRVLVGVFRSPLSNPSAISCSKVQWGLSLPLPL